jgi:tRNA G18 (ribose-2'-O)-methylase SpoU
MERMNKVYVLLHNIRSTHNVGSVFRTSDACGVEKIFLTGITPTPLDQFNRPRADIAKVALGAEKTIPWEYKKTPTAIISKLKKEGFTIIALEQSERSVDYKTVKVSGPTLIILGNEVKGMSKALIEKCDIVAEITMKGNKESLNVSVSAGIFLFRLLNI